MQGQLLWKRQSTYMWYLILRELPEMSHKLSSKMYHFLPKFWNLPHLNKEFSYIQGVNKVCRHWTIAYNFRSNIHLMFKFCKLKEVFQYKDIQTNKNFYSYTESAKKWHFITKVSNWAGQSNRTEATAEGIVNCHLFLLCSKHYL